MCNVRRSMNRHGLYSTEHVNALMIWSVISYSWFLEIDDTGFAITGSAVALHCYKAHSKSIGKMNKFDPLWNLNPWKFHFETWHTWLRREHHPLHKFSCTSLHGGFSANRWNITLLWLFSCPVLSFFSRSHAQLEPRDRFFAIYGSNDVVPPKDGPFWG